MPTPVIDLFAGPGGLGEGFSSLLAHSSERAFKIKLSIEKDEHAHRTLELRAFFRQFPHGKAPDAYYAYLTGEISRSDLFQEFPREAAAAQEEAWHAELGSRKFPNRLIDQRIRVALGRSEAWVLIGGPPCQAYSLVGRSRIMGESEEKYEADARHHLYRRYLRIIAHHQPPVFVMENVKGLLSATLRRKRIFQRILRDLEHPLKTVPEARGQQGPRDLEYRLFPLVNSRGDLIERFEPEEFVVRMEQHGIPQTRHRIIVLGVRSDLKQVPRVLRKGDSVHIEQVIRDLPALRSGLSKEADTAKAWGDAVKAASDAPWMNDGKTSVEVRRKLREVVKKLRNGLTRGAEFVSGNPQLGFADEWFRDPRLPGFCNHAARGHIREDLHRYLFAAVFAQVYGRSPRLEEFPAGLLPKHENVAEALKGSKFNDRFRVQLAGRPATTVVSHIAKDGHYFIHYDPTQCRSLTVREAARLQTFPDNYFFEGPRTEQYQQVGNAVPPLLARQIAEVVAELLR
jgi:DNA (cytosine-5)-methyltransferase 1